MIALAGRQFVPPGPVAAAFMADRRSEIRAILGPQGGGKTVTCIHDLIGNAALQPSCRDGVIRFRAAAIRDTYDRLEKTTIKTWTEWVPKDLGEWSGGGGRAASHKLRFGVQRGGREIPVEFETIFAAIGDQAAEDFMRGFEVTAFWLNEMDLLVEDVLTFAIGRVGRYPRAQDMPEGVQARKFVIGDLNAPDVDSWFYKRFEEERPAGHELYRQPSGRSARAENIKNLVKGYYDDQLRLNASKPKWIKRFIDAQYGPSDDGEPVFPEYSDDIHFSRTPLKVLKGVPLKLGLDAGIQRPAAVIGQRASNGQFRVLAEVVPGRMGATRFAAAIKLKIAEIAPNHEIEVGYADPAGFAGADKENNELAWAETVAHELGVPILPAPSNEIGLRLDAVRDELTYMIEPNVPALIYDPSCKILRKGSASHYCYRRQQVGNTARYADKPDKGEWSHVQDAKQYWLLGEKGRYGVIRGERARKGQQGSVSGDATILNADFNVLG